MNNNKIKRLFAEYMVDFNGETKEEIINSIQKISVIKETNNYNIYSIETEGNDFNFLVYDNGIVIHLLPGRNRHCGNLMALVIEAIPYLF